MENKPLALLEEALLDGIDTLFLLVCGQLEKRHREQRSVEYLAHVKTCGSCEWPPCARGKELLAHYAVCTDLKCSKCSASRAVEARDREMPEKTYKKFTESRVELFAAVQAFKAYRQKFRGNERGMIQSFRQGELARIRDMYLRKRAAFELANKRVYSFWKKLPSPHYIG